MTSVTSVEPTNQPKCIDSSSFRSASGLAPGESRKCIKAPYCFWKKTCAPRFHVVSGWMIGHFRYLEVCEMWSNFHPDPNCIPLNPGPFCTWVTLGWRNFQNLWGWCGKNCLTSIVNSAPGHWRQVTNHFCWGFLKKKDRMEESMGDLQNQPLHDVRIVHKCEFISAHRYAFKSSHKHTSNTWLKAGFLASA